MVGGLQLPFGITVPQLHAFVAMPDAKWQAPAAGTHHWKRIQTRDRRPGGPITSNTDNYKSGTTQ